jgi:hypothetical protein
LGARQQLVAFRQRTRPRAGLVTLALSADNSTLAARKKPRDLPLAARRLAGAVLAALRQVRSWKPSARASHT